MAYSKQKLRSALESIHNNETVDSLGLPRATEEAAIELFLNKEIWSSEASVSIIREALTDLRDKGNFNYHDGSPNLALCKQIIESLEAGVEHYDLSDMGDWVCRSDSQVAEDGFDPYPNDEKWWITKSPFWAYSESQENMTEIRTPEELFEFWKVFATYEEKQGK